MNANSHVQVTSTRTQCRFKPFENSSDRVDALGGKPAHDDRVVFKWLWTTSHRNIAVPNGLNFVNSAAFGDLILCR